MGAEKKFAWLADDCYDGFGRKLEKGKSYDVAAFGEAVVEEWVKTGAAKSAAAKQKEAKEG